MHIAFIDDSIAYDADTPVNRPLGGFEKAVIGMATALAARGNRVSVVNRRETPTEAGGVHWLPWDATRPRNVDALVAARRPTLLDGIDSPGQRILWLSGHAGYLTKPVNQEKLDAHDPTLLFLGHAHFNTWRPWRKFRASVIEPGLNKAFQGADGVAPPERAPQAIVTTHPLSGLAEILDIWRLEIRADAPNATLRVFSAALARGMAGKAVDDRLKPVLETVQGLAGQGVVVEAPGADGEMAKAYRQARVHLYPRVEREVYCATLAESQACGLPAVAMNTPATDERVRNGQTGFLVHNRTTMARTAVRLLTDEGTLIGLARDAELLQGGRNWAQAAVEFETLCEKGAG